MPWVLAIDEPATSFIGPPCRFIDSTRAARARTAWTNSAISGPFRVTESPGDLDSFIRSDSIMPSRFPPPPETGIETEINAVQEDIQEVGDNMKRVETALRVLSTSASPTPTNCSQNVSSSGRKNDGQTVGLLGHVTELSNGLALLTNRGFLTTVLTSNQHLPA